MNRTLLMLAAVAAPLVAPLMAQDARQIVEESQRRGRANSQRYEGVLEVTGADSKVTRKSWQSWRLGSYGNSKAVIRFTAPARNRRASAAIAASLVRSMCGSRRSSASTIS